MTISRCCGSVDNPVPWHRQIAEQREGARPVLEHAVLGVLQPQQAVGEHGEPEPSPRTTAAPSASGRDAMRYEGSIDLPSGRWSDEESAYAGGVTALRAVRLLPAQVDAVPVAAPAQVQMPAPRGGHLDVGRSGCGARSTVVCRVLPSSVARIFSSSPERVSAWPPRGSCCRHPASRGSAAGRRRPPPGWCRPRPWCTGCQTGRRTRSGPIPEAGRSLAAGMRTAGCVVRTGRAGLPDPGRPDHTPTTTATASTAATGPAISSRRRRSARSNPTNQIGVVRRVPSKCVQASGSDSSSRRHRDLLRGSVSPLPPSVPDRRCWAWCRGHPAPPARPASAAARGRRGTAQSSRRSRARGRSPRRPGRGNDAAPERPAGAATVHATRGRSRPG